MPDWWDGSTDERYWCEITDRADVGEDLRTPQQDETGKKHWSYSLVQSVVPGDIVFHYSTQTRQFIGASVAGGPLEDRLMKWTPHGLLSEEASKERLPRPGWWLPLHDYVEASDPLTQAQVTAPAEAAWVRGWLDEKTGSRVCAPFQRYRDSIRTNQAYLTKMPREFVERWDRLGALARRLESSQDKIDSSVLPHLDAPVPTGGWTQRPIEEYLVTIRGTTRRQTRRHEILVNRVRATLVASGTDVTNPYPIDLLVNSPTPVIIEAKTVGGRSALFAVREAVGQLHEYRHFDGPETADLCILLDQEPDHKELVAYVEDSLGILLAWWTGTDISGGPKTTARFADLGISI